MDFMLEKYNNLSLEVSTDNEQAVNFYIKIGLDLSEKYSTQDGIEFAKFDTPLDYKFEKKVPSLVAKEEQKIANSMTAENTTTAEKE